MSTILVRDRFALAFASIALLLGFVAAVFIPYDSGIRWRLDGDRLVVDSVAPGSQAERDGVTLGSVAVDFNGRQLLRLPEPVFATPDPSAGPDGSAPDPDASPAILRYEPPSPTGAVSTDELLRLAAGPIQQVSLISPDQVLSPEPNSYSVQGFFYPGSWLDQDASFALIPGTAVLVIGIWWLRSTRAGPSLRPLAIPLAGAVAMPLLVTPLAATGGSLETIAAGFLTIAAMVPLALGLLERIEDRGERQTVIVIVTVFGVMAAFLIVGLANGYPTVSGALFRWILIGSIPLLPGLIAAGPINLDSFRAGSHGGAGGLLQSTELAIAGATPLFAIGTDRPPYLWPLAVWLLAIAIAGRFTVRPLARLATRATLQRDLVVAATEAERARLAADIHDDALQELTLLVRRLEASGDTEGAEIGRTVADRLRAICGDLRLPILDDLGVGPALDWLVLRIERLAGGEVRLERADDARHSPDVELAIFRVAQEALANAVKHGRPPIVVRYRSTSAGISLAVDDAGPGIAEDAPETAEQAGRFGLLNMAQRAEQIGAILDVRRWPGGGTHVALEWRPR